MSAEARGLRLVLAGLALLLVAVLVTYVSLAQLGQRPPVVMLEQTTDWQV